jgi:hypothetical protein
MSKFDLDAQTINSTDRPLLHTPSLQISRTYD